MIMSLSAHTSTNRATEAEVLAVPEPEWTKTFHPVSHGKVVQSLDKAIKSLGLEVNNRQYSLNKSGTWMFGTWSLDLGTSTTGYELGFRNSLDKWFALGICAGTRVFVCDNMCFSGEFITMRRHTAGLDYEEVEDLGMKAVRGAVAEMEKLTQWQEGMREIYVPKPDFKQLAFDMVAEGVFGPSKLMRYVEAVDEEIKVNHSGVLNGARTLHAVHGGVTRLIRELSLHTISDVTRKLNGICDDYMALKAA
jgi:hypothetical protein